MSRVTEHDLDPIVEDGDDIPSNPSTEAVIGAVIDARLSRRGVLKGLAATAAVAGVAGVAGIAGTTALTRPAQAMAGFSTLTFPELDKGYDEQLHVARGYDADVLLRWGDPVMTGAPAFDPMNQTAAAQAMQFGYNNDYVGFMPLPVGSKTSDHGLICVNHEYTNADLMFPGITSDNYMEAMTRELVDIEMAAHGHSVVEIKKTDGTWRVVAGSPRNRRITVETDMEITGPAAGHERLKTSTDGSGRRVKGTLNNCAGGETPWGTVLIAEENFHGYFRSTLTQTYKVQPGDTADGLAKRASDVTGAAWSINELAAFNNLRAADIREGAEIELPLHKEARNYLRYGIKDKSRYAWSKYHERFNADQEPHEPNRFGWMVEIDPYDPESIPKKRTALGRFKHEGATIALNKDGRVVAYSGDDQRFDYVYKFVSSRAFDPSDRLANMDILDDGTLFVAKFNDDGTMDWMPLVWGQGPLTAANGFASQADVLIETRRAADLLGATPMDRPEDVEPNPATGVVYVMLTNNTKRKESQVSAANPRPKNKHGHILEMIPPGAGMGGGADADHTATRYRWEIMMLCGDPSKSEGARYHPATTENGWLTTPDNCAFDNKGRLWITTDGAPKSGIADGVWATDTEGAGRALPRHFLRVPRGAEMCGPAFTPDDTTFFCAVQHPADEKGSTFANPSTRWPDFQADMPVRPSLVTVTRQGGGVIGG